MKYSDLMYTFCQRGNCMWWDSILGRLEIPFKRGESGSGGSSTAFQLGESLSRFWLAMRPCLTPHLAVRPLLLSHQKTCFSLYAPGSSIYPKGTWPLCKPLSFYEDNRKVPARLRAVLVGSIRARCFKTSLLWPGSQLISTAIIKSWALPGGQPPFHPWRGCWKWYVSGKTSSANDHVPTANILWFLFVF